MNQEKTVQRNKWRVGDIVVPQNLGQALAETALVTVVLLLLLSMIIDFGRGMFTWLAMQNAAAEGAYYAANFSHPSQVGTVGGSNPDTVIYRTQHESPSVLLDWTDPDVDVSVSWNPPVTLPDRPVPGSRVMVVITYPFDFIGPLPGIFGLNQIDIRAEATQVILNDSDLPQ